MLGFANTPMQYYRMEKKAVQDIINGRGSTVSNLGKVAYYGFAQNALFSFLQNALWSDDIADDEKKLTMVNSMLDSQLRGMGIVGNFASVGKDFVYKIYDEMNKPRPQPGDAIWELAGISPVIGNKAYKVKSALEQFDSKRERNEIKDKGFSDPLNNPAYDATFKMIDAGFNLPLTNAAKKLRRYKQILETYDNKQKSIEDKWKIITMYLLGYDQRTTDPDAYERIWKEERAKYGASNKKSTNQGFKGTSGGFGGNKNLFKKL
jgi:hypothetical protein